MEKPIDLKIEDTKYEIINIINKSNLPAFILEPIFKDIYNQLLLNKNRDLEKSRKKYMDQQKNETEIKNQNKGGINGKD